MPDHPQMNELADEHGMDLHYGREDKPHVHEWGVMAVIPYLDSHCRPFAYCRDTGCDVNLEKEELERRLNATQKLSAATAIGASVTVSAEHHSKALLAYAAELEKD